jgi:DNA topoisomerase-1
MVLRDRDTIERINKLVIPSAYTAVWICSDPNGHLQATGRDARGREQYRYHARLRQIRVGTRYEHMIAFAQAHPTIRRAVAEHMSMRGLPREKVLATVVHLLETTVIRIGNADYAKRNKSYGQTTMGSRHVRVEGSDLKFKLKGKSGKEWNLNVLMSLFGIASENRKPLEFVAPSYLEESLWSAVSIPSAVTDNAIA